VSTVVVRAFSGIGNTYVMDRKKEDGSGKELFVQTDGINFKDLWQMAHLIDLNKIM
jgi:hypothetical protein